MIYKNYDADLHSYDLGEGYTLQRADNAEFLKYWAIYRSVNEDFSQSFDATKEELIGIPFCFWISNGGDRVGGIIMLPNNIGDFFLIPPASDASSILSKVIRLLDHWSDNSKPMRAQAIPSRYHAAFQAAGFTNAECRCWMIRPTAALQAEFGPDYRVERLMSRHAADIATLLKSAFANDPGQYGKRDLEAHRASVDRFFEKHDSTSLFGKASLGIIDKESGKLIGVCMVETHKAIPTIRMVAVDPDCQRQGLAANMISNAVHLLEPSYDWVKLAVSLNNPAIALYQKLGFIAGDTLCEYYKSTTQPPSET